MCKYDFSYCCLYKVCSVLHCKFAHMCIHDFFLLSFCLYYTLIDPWNVHLYVYIYIYIYMHVCVCVCVCMYVCMYFKAQNNIETMIDQTKELTKKC